MSTRWRHRLAKAACIVAVVSLAGVPAGAQTESSDSVESGGTPRGDANGQVVSVIPVAGRLALPIKLFTSGARVEDEVTRGSAGTVDAGLLGSLATLALTNTPTLAQLGLDTAPFRSFQLPGVTVADSRTTTEASDNPVVPKLNLGVVEMGGGNQYASAQPKGEGRGRTEGGGFTVDLGPITLSLGGLVTESVAGQNRATQTTSIGEMKITGFGLPFVARGLEWTVSQEIGKPAVGAFNMGSFQFGVSQVASPSIEQLTAAFDQFNAVLKPSGFFLELPKIEVSEAGGRVTPLRIGLSNSQAAGQFLGPIYEMILADVVNQLESAIVGGVPETGLAITVANVAIAAAVGRGGASVELGGGDARLIRTPVESYAYEALEGDQAAFDESSITTDDSSFDTGGDLTSSSDSSSFSDSSLVSGGSVTDLASAPADTSGGSEAAAADFGAQADYASFGRVLEDEDFPAWLLVLAGLALTIAMWASDRTRIRRLLEVSR